MPLYEYACPDCQITFDALRSMAKADDPIACPQCTGMEASRKLSLFAAFSKGNGSESSAVAGSGGCASCAGGSCGTCGHH